MRTINTLLSKLREKNRIWSFLLKWYEPPVMKFVQLPYPLMFKCLRIFAASVGMLFISALVAVTDKSVRPFMAGAILSVVCFGIAYYHVYIFTRKRYVRRFAYVARREESKSVFKRGKNISTFIVMADGSERELMLGRRKLNIGGEYAFYFAPFEGTREPNLNALYGFEAADEAVARDNEQKLVAETQQINAAKVVSVPAEFPDDLFRDFPPQMEESLQPPQKDNPTIIDLDQFRKNNK